MCLIHEQSVNAQFLKGHNIVLLFIRLKLFQSGFQTALGSFQLLDGESFGAAHFEFRNSRGNFINLFFQQRFLPRSADGDFLKLRVADNDRVIITGSDPGAELFPVSRFKVFLLCDQNIGRGIQPQELRRPLLRKVIGDNEQRFPAQPQPFGLHGSPHHFKRLARTNLVCQQRVPAVKYMGDGIPLMLPQGNLRVHTRKDNVTAVIFPWPDAVHVPVVLLH